MAAPPPEELIAKIRALPAARPLLGHLGDEPGVHLVGGAVRDLLLGRAPFDLDIVVEGDALELARRLGGEVTSYSRFGTATVVLEGMSYDLATSRRERYAHPGALPEVEPAGLEADLRRRDFTVNAMAAALGNGAPGALTAAPEAFADLEHGWLRILHEASFIDDPTRLLRLARYGARLGFAPHPETHRLALEAIRAGALSTVSGDRIGAELRLLVREADPLAGLAALRRLELAAAIAPGFGEFDADVARSALGLLPPNLPRDRLVLALATQRMDARGRRALLEELAFSAPDRDVIEATAGRAQELAEVLGRTSSRSAIAAAARGAPAELVALAGALGPRAHAALWLDDLRHVALEIGGDDLLSAGVAPGPDVGRGLRAALAAKLDGAADGREDELAAALAAARGEPEGER